MARAASNAESSNLIFTDAQHTACQYLRDISKNLPQISTVDSQTWNAGVSSCPQSCSLTFPSNNPMASANSQSANVRFINCSDILMETECEVINRGLTPLSAQHSSRRQPQAFPLPTKGQWPFRPGRGKDILLHRKGSCMVNHWLGEMGQRGSSLWWAPAGRLVPHSLLVYLLSTLLLRGRHQKAKRSACTKEGSRVSYQCV